jgi:hypothetical protein
MSDSKQSRATTSRRARLGVIIAAAVVLAILHQDWWWWGEPGPVLGFLPTGLAFHALYSILAASLWACVVWFAWPHHLESASEDPR